MTDLSDSHTEKQSAALTVLAPRLAVAAIPCWLTLSFVTSSSAPVELRAMVGIVAILPRFIRLRGWTRRGDRTLRRSDNHGARIATRPPG